VNQSPRDNDLPQLSRRAHFEATGRWPKGTSGDQRWRLEFTKADTANRAPKDRPTDRPAVPQQTPQVPLKSAERLAWEAAYSGPELGPIGGSWPADGRHVPRMVWKLPYNCGSNRPSPPRNF
jgi:hypothetical protein